MPEATLQLVARRAGVAPVTVSRVVNGSENVARATREKNPRGHSRPGLQAECPSANLRRRKLNGESAGGSKTAGVLFEIADDGRRMYSGLIQQFLVHQFTKFHRQWIAHSVVDKLTIFLARDNSSQGQQRKMF